MDTRMWSEEQWGQARLGDARRNTRAIKIATNVLDKPSASFPQQCFDWAALKAAYRFFNEDDVSFEALQAPHRSLVIQKAKKPGITLFIQDGSDLDYSSREIELGPIGNHHGQGFCLHTTLAVHVEEDIRHVLGIAHQILWERQKKQDSETRTQRRARSNEADVWASSAKAIGSSSIGCLWVHVGDRGADIFEFLETCQSNQHEAVVRMIQDRKVSHDGQMGKIFDFLTQKPSQGSFKLIRRGREGKPATTHQLQLSWIAVEIQPPRYRGKNCLPLKGTYIRVWEDKVDGLEWILFSTLPIKDFKEAHEKVKWYSMRWMIEEYHKCLKTGCGVENRNLRCSQALQAVIGMLGVIAVKLLEVKYLIREGKTDLAQGIIPDDLIGIICRHYRLESKELTLKEFWRGVARLGGFIGRKSDGEPGWQTLWKGWIRLLDKQEALADLQKCG